MTDRLALRLPDDWHVHLRDGELLRAVLPHTARAFGRAIAMPNLVPPVTTSAAAAAYRDRILAALPPGSRFAPLMALYLTDRTDPDDVAAGVAQGVVSAVKLYPAGATTHSEAGVTDVQRVEPVLARLEALGVPLLVHGEATDPEVDVFDREAWFLDRVLEPMLQRHPALKVVLEHVTTREAVALVRARAPRVAATITAHHLLANRNDLLVGGIRPHFYCLPVLKRAAHQRALIEAATSGEAAFFLGTDSAPHLAGAKESACGCAGCFTAPAALALYAEAFERAGALGQLEAFASEHGPRFYGVAPNAARVELVREPWRVPERIDTVDGPIVPFFAGRELSWRIGLGRQSASASRRVRGESAARGG